MCVCVYARQLRHGLAYPILPVSELCVYALGDHDKLLLWKPLLRRQVFVEELMLAGAVGEGLGLVLAGAAGEGLGLVLAETTTSGMEASVGRGSGRDVCAEVGNCKRDKFKVNCCQRQERGAWSQCWKIVRQECPSLLAET